MKNNLAGQKFGRLTILYKSGKSKNGHSIYSCLCDCGKRVDIFGTNLKMGYTKSCGCLRKEVTINKNYKHGDARKKSTTRLNQTWQNMKARCHNPNANEYNRYGGRGIEVCSEWKNSYIVFKIWALKNGYQDDLTIDRIDNNGNYEPSNCQFITLSENIKNRQWPKKICSLCKKPIEDPIYECHYDPGLKEIVYHHRQGYCKKGYEAPYMYMRRTGQVKWD